MWRVRALRHDRDQRVPYQLAKMGTEQRIAKHLDQVLQLES